MENIKTYILCSLCCLATISMALGDSGRRTRRYFTLDELPPHDFSYPIRPFGVHVEPHVPAVVHITTPPKLIIQPRKEWAYKEGEPIRLPCEASGTPPIEYHWQKDLSPVEIDGLYVRQEAGSGTLVITPPATEDGEDDIDGVYQCFANNQFGTAVSVRSLIKKAYIKTFHTLPEPKQLFPLVGNYLNLTCHPPESYPKAIVYWTSGTGEDFQNVPLSKRVALDYDGNLHIANVMEEDENFYTCNAKNDYLRVTSEGDDTLLNPQPILGTLHFVNVDESDSGDYACTVQNYVLRTFAQGDDKVINVKPAQGTPSYKAPKLVWSSPQEVVAVQGEVVKMMCIFSGYPTPDVKWERVSGGEANSRMDFASAGGLELKIKKVQSEDAGRYKCTATSPASDTTVSRLFTLQVEYPPQWADGQEPKDVTASEEEDAEIVCAADAHPPPNWVFTFNGKEIRGGGDLPDDRYIPEDDRISIEGDTVHFKNLTKTDTQVIQCNVSNVHGYLFTNVFLNVLAEPPYFIEEPEAVVKRAEGQEVILKCRVFGAPKPTITWLRGDTDEEVKGPRFEVLPEGDLRIMPAVREDMNMYTCRARNKFGQMTRSGQLLIRERTSIDYHPQGKVVVAGTEVSFFCNATTDVSEMSRLKIRWLKNGHEIDYFREGRISKDMRDNSLHITMATPEDSGSYTCVASNGIDEDQSTAQLTVRDRPDPPTNLNLVGCTSSRAQISWTPGDENKDEVIEFIVKYNTSFDEPNVYHVGAKTKHGEHTAQIELSPYANYTFHVLARNSLGISDPSPFTQSKCETPAKKPTHDPDWVCTSSEEPDQLVIRWKTFPPIKHNGSDFHYVIKYRMYSDPFNTEQRIEEHDWKKGKLVVPNQPVFTQYQVSVKTANEKGISRGGDKWVDGYSGEDIPEVTPENFALDEESLNATHAKFYWDPVDTSTEVIHGHFVGYRIVYWRNDDPEDKRSTEFIENEIPQCPPEGEPDEASRVRRAAMEEGTVGDLWPYSSISAAIQVMNGGKSGALSDPPLQFNTPEGVPGPVPFFSIVETGSHHLKVEWLPPLEPNGILTHYMIGYQEVGSPDGTVYLPMVDAFRTHKKIHDLKEDTMYVVYIWAHTSKGPGIAMRDEGRTLVAAVPDMPGIENFDIGDTWVNVSWTPSEEEQKNPGTYFYVEYKKPGSDEWERTPIEKEHNWFNVTDLEPGPTEIRIVAVNGRGDERRSEPVVVHVGSREEAQTSVASAGWFIGIMCALIFLLLVLLIVCLIRRNRGGKYPVYEKEKLAGRDPDKEDEEAGFGEFNKNDEPEKKKSRTSLNSEERPLESDTDSMAEYYETDPSKFNEDGSFIGQYGGKKKAEPDTTSPSALSTFV